MRNRTFALLLWFGVLTSSTAMAQESRALTPKDLAQEPYDLEHLLQIQPVERLIEHQNRLGNAGRAKPRGLLEVQHGKPVCLR